MTGTLSELLAAAPDVSVALIDGEQLISYGELDETSRRLATGLLELGIEPMDRIGVLLPNLPAWPTLVFAAARIGAVVVAINTRFGRAEVADTVSRAGCKALVVPGERDLLTRVGIESKLASSGIIVLTSLAVTSQVSAAGAVPYAGLLDCPPLDRDRATSESPCCMFTTSGTTHAPKFVLHKQSALVAHAQAAATAFGYRDDDTVTLQATPFCGVYGFSQALATFAAGRPTVVLRAFDAAEAVRLVADHRVTQFNGTDEMMDRLLSVAADAHAFESLRFFGCALFGPAPAEIVTRAEARGVRVRGLFGMSETQALLALQPDSLELDERMRGGGTGVSPAVKVRARDRDSGELLAHGESGELEISTPGLMVEYFNDPEATAAVLTDDGFLRSGDLGFTRPDGGFVFQSRLGDVLRLGGYLVSPREIEACLNQHGSVASSQVVGIPVDTRLRAIAFVTSTPGVAFDEASLREHCGQALASFKVPFRVLRVDEFPTADGPNGRKVQRGRLRELAQAQLHASS